MFKKRLPLAFSCAIVLSSLCDATERPHIVLVMADDQGWGETSYNGHPRLQTPNLDALAAEGVRFDRFYAGGPVCSPTRATVLTGRNHNRCGVPSHGHALRRQEITIAQMLKRAGYRTGHFGKWHLNGLRGPGVPILADDTHHPGVFGFDHWLSVTNFFDRDPILGRKGAFEEFRGDSSEIVIREALEFLSAAVHEEIPSFSVVWFGTPHDPFFASEADASAFADLDDRSQQHYGELVALDRSMGALRDGVKSLGVADNTLIWYCSDNGGLNKITPTTVSDLRGFKGTLYEGGLRVPGIFHWPAKFRSKRVEHYPASAADIMPTLSALLGLQLDATRPIDGTNLIPVLEGKVSLRLSPLCFHYQGNTAVIDNDMKLIKLTDRKGAERYELYDLRTDRSEENNLAVMPIAAKTRLISVLDAFETSMQLSIEGKDYPEGKVADGEPSPSFWMTHPGYKPHLDSFRVRPEYEKRLK